MAYRKQLRHVNLFDFDDKIKFVKKEVLGEFYSNSIVLDAGCGDMNYLISHRDVSALIGLDYDYNAVSSNIYVSHKVVGDLECFNFTNASFDIIMCYDVIEHLNSPEEFIKTTFYYLKSGGLLIILTPNFFSLFGILAYAIPNKWKIIFLKILTKKTERFNIVHHYKMNTEHRLYNTLVKMGYSDINVVMLNSLPSSKGMRIALYIYYQLCKLPLLRNLSIGILCTARKP